MSTNNNNNNNNNNDEDNDNHSRDKRQKLNNDNDSGDTEIDITNLEKKTIPQLKEIVLSLGITIKNGTRKSDIIERIKLEVKRKQDTVIKQNINSFNKGVIEFTIKDGVDPLEWLFWSVFRNKFIYKLIMSNMEKQFSVQYDSITSVERMTQSNQISILRDKVARNQHLMFDDIDKDTFRIFSTFNQNTEENRLFFKQFFKCYTKFIPKFNAVIVVDFHRKINFKKGNQREDLVNEMIRARCLPALQILTQDYQYIPNHSNVIVAINNGSIKFIKFFLQHQPQLNKEAESYLKSIVPITPNWPVKTYMVNGYLSELSFAKICKSLYYLHYEKIIDMTHTNTTIQFNETTTTTLNLILEYIKSNVKQQINESTTLKTLIIIGKLISSNGYSNEIIEHNEIESFSNSLLKQELKLQLSDPSFQIQHKKEFIIKLLNLYYSLCKFEINIGFYYLYFKFNASDHELGTVYNGENLIIHFNRSFQLADLTIFDQCIKGSISGHLERLVNCYNKRDGNILFSHCSGESNHQTRLKFIKSILKHIKSISPIYFTYELINLYNLLVGCGDIELLKYITSYENGSNFFGTSTARFIKSNEMLDYLLENHNYILTRGDFIWGLIGNLQLFKHYESLHRQTTGSPISVVNPDYICKTSNLPNEILEHILESGPSIYKIEGTTIQYVYDMINFHYPTDHGKFKMMKLLFINYLLPQFKIRCGGGVVISDGIKRLEFTNKISSFANPRYLNWLFINHRDYLLYSHRNVLSKLGLYHDGIAVEVYLLTGRYNQLVDNSIFHLVTNYIDNVDTNSLDFIFNNLENSETDFKLVVSKIIESGKLHLLEHIQHNHNWALKPKPMKAAAEDGLLFTIKEFKNLLLGSLRTNNLEISELLFQYANVTELELTQNYNSAATQLHFKKLKNK